MIPIAGSPHRLDHLHVVKFVLILRVAMNVAIDYTTMLICATKNQLGQRLLRHKVPRTIRLNRSHIIQPGYIHVRTLVLKYRLCART